MFAGMVINGSRGQRARLQRVESFVVYLARKSGFGSVMEEGEFASTHEKR